MHHRVTRTARARRRSGGQKRPSGAFLERGRVPGNVAGVERRGDGERQGLEIKKVQVCKSVYGNNKFDGSLLRIFDVWYSRPWRGRVTTLYSEF